MNVLILSSSSVTIDNKYLTVAEEVSNLFADNGYDLVYGAASFSMMGKCYDVFANKGQDIYAFTTEKYKSDLINLEQAKKYVRETTFDMKKSMFENSDIIIALPGGLGTLSEITSYIEENRSNDKNIPIIIYNVDGYYNHLIQMLNYMIENKFLSEEVMDTFNIISDYNELKELVLKYKVKTK